MPATNRPVAITAAMRGFMRLPLRAGRTRSLQEHALAFQCFFSLGRCAILPAPGINDLRGGHAWGVRRHRPATPLANTGSRQPVPFMTQDGAHARSQSSVAIARARIRGGEAHEEDAPRTPAPPVVRPAARLR